MKTVKIAERIPRVEKDLPHDKNHCKIAISTHLATLMETDSKLKRFVLCKLLMEEMDHLL